MPRLKENRTNNMWQALARLRHPGVTFVPRAATPESPVDAVVTGTDGAKRIVGTWTPGFGGGVQLPSAKAEYDASTMTEASLKAVARRLQDEEPELKWSHALEGAAIRYGFNTYNAALFHLKRKETM